MSFFKNLAGDTFKYGSIELVSRVLSFFTFPIFAKLLSVDDFGIQALITTTMGFVSSFMLVGFNNSVHRFYYDTETKESDRPIIVSSGLYFLIIWSLIIGIIALCILYFVKDILLTRFNIKWDYIWVSILAIIPTTLIQYVSDTLRLYYTPGKFAVIALLKNISGVALGIYFLKYLNLGLGGTFWALLLSALPLFFISLFFIKKDLSLVFNLEWVKKMFDFGYPFIFVGLAYYLFFTADRWLLGIWTNTSEVGYYSISSKISMVVLFAMTAIGQAFSPLAMKYISEDPDNYKRKIGELLTYIYILFILLGTCIACFSKELLMLLTDQVYWKATTTTVIMSLALSVYATVLITPLGITIAKRTSVIQNITWATAIVNLVLNYFLINWLAAEGAAIALFLTFLFLTSAYIFYTQKLHSFLFQYNRLLGLLILNIFIIFMVLVLNTIENFVLGILIKSGFIFIVIIVLLTTKLIDISDLKARYIQA